MVSWWEILVDRWLGSYRGNWVHRIQDGEQQDVVNTFRFFPEILKICN